MSKRVIKTAICVDPMGCMGKTPEEEIKEHKKDYREWLKPALLKIYRIDSVYPGEIKPGTELVLFDYGGMGTFGNDMMENNCRHIIQWALDNPGGLIVFISSYAWDYMGKYIMEDFGYHQLPNIVVAKGAKAWEGKHIPDWFKNNEASPEKKKGYFCSGCHREVETSYDLNTCCMCQLNPCKNCYNERTLICYNCEVS
jgi:hypothetical protein